MQLKIKNINQSLININYPNCNKIDTTALNGKYHEDFISPENVNDPQTGVHQLNELSYLQTNQEVFTCKHQQNIK